MYSIARRARLGPGPLLLISLFWLAIAPATLQAHDPGLSALDVSVSHRGIAVSLSVAEADVERALPNSDDPRQKLNELARQTIRLSVDGNILMPVDDHVSIGDGGARVLLSYALPPSIPRTGRLTVASDVPKRISPGHRQLAKVSVDGRAATEKLLDARSDSVTLDLAVNQTSRPGAVLRFGELGLRHILSGYDHLVFLAGLLLAARTLRELAVALTAFTAAHSVSLALVVIGGVHAPSSIVEPLIAASICWVGLENLLRQPRRRQWLVVFGVGLIHGFGFAGALVELGFGSSVADMAVALLSFNAGVEAGQLAVAAALLPVVWATKSKPVWEARLLPICSLSIAMAGGYFLFSGS